MCFSHHFASCNWWLMSTWKNIPPTLRVETLFLTHNGTWGAWLLKGLDIKPFCKFLVKKAPGREEKPRPLSVEQEALSRFWDYFLSNPCDCGQDFNTLISSGRLSLVLLLLFSLAAAWEYLQTGTAEKKRRGGEERMRWWSGEGCLLWLFWATAS